MKELRKIILKYFNKQENEVFIEDRNKDLILVRFIYFYFCRKYLKSGYVSIGQSTALKQNHSSVVHGAKRIRELLEVGDRQTVNIIKDLDEIIILEIGKIDVEFEEKKLKFIKKIKKTENYMQLKTIVQNGY